MFYEDMQSDANFALSVLQEKELKPIIDSNEELFAARGARAKLQIVKIDDSHIEIKTHLGAPSRTIRKLNNEQLKSLGLENLIMAAAR